MKEDLVQAHDRVVVVSTATRLELIGSNEPSHGRAFSRIDALR
jgi:hypothetical protein